MRPIGQLLVIASREIDDSVGSTAGFSAFVGATLVDPRGSGRSIVVLAAGAAVGLVDGVIVVLALDVLRGEVEGLLRVA